jgi:hypothetical protein
MAEFAGINRVEVEEQAPPVNWPMDAPLGMYTRMRLTPDVVRKHDKEELDLGLLWPELEVSQHLLGTLADPIEYLEDGYVGDIQFLPPHIVNAGEQVISSVGFCPAGRVGTTARRCTESGSTSGSANSDTYSDTETDMDCENIFNFDAELDQPDDHFQAGPLPPSCLPPIVFAGAPPRCGAAVAYNSAGSASYLKEYHKALEYQPLLQQTTACKARLQLKEEATMIHFAHWTDDESDCQEFTDNTATRCFKHAFSWVFPCMRSADHRGRDMHLSVNTATLETEAEPLLDRSRVWFHMPWISNISARDHLAQHRRRPCDLQALV